MTEPKKPTAQHARRLRRLIPIYEQSSLRPMIQRILPGRLRRVIGSHLSSRYLENQIRDRVDDATILMADFPRCGNTWLRYMVATVLHLRATDRLEKLGEVEFYVYCPTLLGREDYAPYEFNGSTLLKTHESHRPEFRRGIITYRSPYPALRSLRALELREAGDFGDLMAELSDDQQLFLDSIDRFRSFNQSWLDAKRDHPENFIFIEYDEMRRHTEEVLRAVCEFVGIDSATLSKDVISSVASMYSKQDVSRKTDRDERQREQADRFLNRLYSEDTLRELDPARFKRLEDLWEALRANSFRYQPVAEA